MTLACVGFVGSSRSICAFHDNHDTYITHSTHTYVFIVFSPVYLLSILADEKMENIHTNGKVFFLHDLNHNYVNVLHDQCTERSCCSLCSSIPSHEYTHIGTLYCVLLNNVQFSMMNFRFHLRLFDVHTELSTWMKWINSFFLETVRFWIMTK